MTDLRPYRAYNEISAVLAISQGKSPASLDDIATPDFVKRVLERCWDGLGAARPAMAWCMNVLAERDADLFYVYSRRRFPFEVPSEYHTFSLGWGAVYNPASRIRYDCHFLTTFNGFRAKYVLTVSLYRKRPAYTGLLSTFRFHQDGRQIVVMDSYRPIVTLADFEAPEKRV